MGIREEAIKQILDEGADMTDENINAVMKSIETKKKVAVKKEKEATVNAITGMQKSIGDKLDSLIAMQGRPIIVPDIKIPEIKVPEIKQPQQTVRDKKKFSFNIVRDVSGNIIALQASEE